MADAYFEDHPTDPKKVILRKRPHLDKGRDYEEGFIDGMQHQMQSSVDKAVNRKWVGLSWEEIDECFEITPDQYLPAQIYKRIEAKLKEKNT